MIILYNIHLKPNRTVFYERPNLRSDDRIDIFKYSIATHAVTDPLVSKFLFFISIDSEWENRKEEIEKFIYNNHDEEKVKIEWKAKETLEEWQNLSYELDKIDDKTIYFLSNEDHIFIDYDLEALFYTIKEVENDPNPFSAMFYSHWPELIRVAKRLGGNLSSSGYSVNFDWSVHDSIRLIRKELWRKYWFDWDFRDLPPSTNISSIKKFLPDGFNVSCHVPTREICRHYDGYSHVGNLFNYYPPLEIPKGFLSKNMTVRYGWNDIWNHDNFSNINPLMPNMKTVDPRCGVDYKLTLDKLPMSWWGRISDINENPHMNEEEMAVGYKNWLYDSLKVPIGAYCMHFNENDFPPIEWIEKHIKQVKMLRTF
jgi:hypothetical protein